MRDTLTALNRPLTREEDDALMPVVGAISSQWMEKSSVVKAQLDAARSDLRRHEETITATAEVCRLEGALSDMRGDECLESAQVAFLAGEVYGFRKGLAAFAAILERPESVGTTRENAALLIASLLTNEHALHSFLSRYLGADPDVNT